MTGINPLSAISNSSSADAAASKFAQDFDDFLLLLVAQLENQDPTAPLDANQFTEQIVSFTDVEQSINTNKKLEQLIDINQGAQNSNIVNFSGKSVEAIGSNIFLDEEGTVNFAYELDDEVEDAFITVRDSNGNIVFNGQGTTYAGMNGVTWEGSNNSGERMPRGFYQVTVTAQDKETKNLNNVETFISGEVAGVNLQAEPPTAIVNGQEIPISELTFIGERNINNL